MSHGRQSDARPEKLDQAPAILEEQGIDLWLTLVRETLLTRDPCLDLIADTYCAWQSAFLVSSSGERIAIVGRFDAPRVEQLGAYSEVVNGHEVDAAARAQPSSRRGYDEPKYALGHQLGRAAHDGGTLLAPLWDRYGDVPLGLVEEGHVYTLEYGAPVDGRGYIGLEEDVLVTADGIEWLSTPQRELWLVG